MPPRHRSSIDAWVTFVILVCLSPCCWDLVVVPLRRPSTCCSRRSVCVRGEVCGVLCVLGGDNRLRGGVAAVVRNRGGVHGDEGRAPSAGPAPATAEGPGRWSTSLNTNAFKSGVATSFFGVYDGHGGPAVSKYCAKHLHTELRKRGQFRHGDLTVAIQDTFLRMDQTMRKRKTGKELAECGGNENWNEYKKAIHSRRFLPSCLQNLPYAGPTSDGCTACVVLIRGNRIFVGNVGDSRCVLSRNDQAIDLSTDHKPNLPAERHRIENAGRAITTSLARGGIPRIDEGIAISRSLGDLQYKNRADLPAERQAMTALPEVRTEDVTHNAQFLIIACDGIWDCMTSQQAVDFVRNYLTANVGLGFICEALLQHCLGEPRGKDNMTVVLVRFKNHLRPLPLPPPPLIPPEGSHGDQEQAAAAAGTNVGGSSSAPATPTGL